MKKITYRLPDGSDWEPSITQGLHVPVQRSIELSVDEVTDVVTVKIPKDVKLIIEISE